MSVEGGRIRFASRKDESSAVAEPATDAEAAGLATGDFAETYEKWMRLTVWNSFASIGLEATYRTYQQSVFGDRVKKWFLFAALMGTCGTINTECGHLITGDDANRSSVALRVQMASSMVVFWICSFCASSVPTAWLHAFYQRQQTILCCLAICFGLSITLPGLLQPDQRSSAAPLDGLDRYVQGHFVALIAATSVMTLAWSDLSPLIFAILSLVLLVLWNVRNIRMQLASLPTAAINGTGALSSAHGESLFGVTLLQYFSTWVGCFFVSYQKDLLMRRNFVILQIVKTEKDKRIRALRGEKDSLEVKLTQLTQHVKFIDRSDTSRAPRDKASFKSRINRVRQKQEFKHQAASHGSSTSQSLIADAVSLMSSKASTRHGTRPPRPDEA